MIIAAFTFLRHPARAASLALALAFALPAGLRAAESHSVSEKTGDAFQKLKPLQEAKDWTGMLAILKGIEPSVDPTSYDMSLILNMEGKLYGQMEQYEKTIEVWDRLLRISEGKDYLEAKDISETLYYLSQFSYTVGLASKVTAVQQKYISSAADYFRRYREGVTNLTPEAQFYYTSLLLNQAMLDPKKVDQSLLKLAHVEAQKTLQAYVHPKENHYTLLMFILQQENDLAGSAEIIELILSLFPGKKDFWPSLWSTYLAMANEKDATPETVRQNYIRAINTQERAQAAGFMKSPKDNLNLVNLYLQAQQFSKGTELLHKWLRDGSVEPDIKNWLALGYYYQQSNQEMTAISALKEAVALFPKNGQIDVTIAEIYRGKDLMKEARDHYRSAVKKGNLEKPETVLAYLANADYTLDDFDDAKATIDEAYQKYPEDCKKDQFLPQLKDAVDRALAERAAARAKRS